MNFGRLRLTNEYFANTHGASVYTPSSHQESFPDYCLREWNMFALGSAKNVTLLVYEAEVRMLYVGIKIGGKMCPFIFQELPSSTDDQMMLWRGVRLLSDSEMVFVAPPPPTHFIEKLTLFDARTARLLIQWSDLEIASSRYLILLSGALAVVPVGGRMELRIPSAITETFLDLRSQMFARKSAPETITALYGHGWLDLPQLSYLFSLGALLITWES